MQEFDRLYKQGWQCIVGRDFGCFVTHQSGCFIYFTIGTLSILLFRGAVTSEEEEMGRQIAMEPVQSWAINLFFYLLIFFLYYWIWVSSEAALAGLMSLDFTRNKKSSNSREWMLFKFFIVAYRPHFQKKKKKKKVLHSSDSWVLQNNKDAVYTFVCLLEWHIEYRIE